MRRNLLIALACLVSLTGAAPAFALNPQPEPPGFYQAGHGGGSR